MTRVITRIVCSAIVPRYKSAYTVLQYSNHAIGYNFRSCACGGNKKRLCEKRSVNFRPFQACPFSTCPPSCDTIYDSRKIHHNLSRNDVTPMFETLKDIPTGVFRNTEGESLGLGAGKDTCYKNPEYFSFHHSTYYDMHMHLRTFRSPCPKTNRKP